MTQSVEVTAQAARRSARFRRLTQVRSTIDGLLFLAPFLAAYIGFLLIPVGQAVLTSAYDWDLLGYTREFIGFDNFERMLWATDMSWGLTQHWPLRMVLVLGIAAVVLRTARSGAGVLNGLAVVAPLALLVAALGLQPAEGSSWNDPAFWTSFGNTVEFTVLSTPVLIALGLSLAIALHSRRRGAGFYRAVFFLPFVLPVSVVTLIWGYLLNPDRGILAGFLGNFGVDPIPWLSDPRLAMPAIILTTVWWSVGFNLVLFLAGLQDIDPTLYEAASIDGAGRWQKFRHVTVPGLRHVTVLVLVTQVIASFQIFGQVYIMTKGGPGDSTRVLIQHVYEAGFRDLELGYASALSLFLFVVMLTVSAIQFRLLSRST